MNCGTCRHDNEPNAKLCSECGAALGLRCSECDAEQLAGSKFCNQCGSALTATPARPDASPPPSPVDHVGVVVTDDQFAGDGADSQVLNTAARLQAASSPDQELVGEDPWRLTRSMTRTTDVFDLDDSAAARRRFHEVTGGEGPADAVWTVPIADSMRNRAVEVLEQALLGDVAADGGPIDPDLFFADDFTFFGRRTSAPHFVAGADHLVSTHQAWNEMGLVEEAPELVAVRGDDLALVRGGLSGDQGELEFLVVIETGADRLIHSWTVFDADQLVDAQLELGRRWCDELGLPDDHISIAGLAAALSLDPDERLRHSAPDVVYTDHRQLWPGGGGLAEAAATSSTVGEYAHVVIPIVHRLSAEGHAVCRQDLHAADGSVSSSLIVVGTRRGRYARYHLYDVDDLDAALARYDEIVVGLADPALTNDAWKVAQPSSAIHAAGDRDGFVAQAGSRDVAPTDPPPLVNDGVRLLERFNVDWLAGGAVDFDDYVEPDFAFADRRRSMPPIDGGPEILRTISDHWTEAGAADLRTRTIAIRDRHLALTEQVVITEGDDELATISVGEVGPSGRWRRVTFFDPDQLHEGLDLLERWFVESGAPEAAARVGVAVRRSYRAGSATMLRSVLSDDFLRVDHRRLGTGTCTADEMAATMEPLGEVGGVDLVNSQFVEYTDRVCLAVTDFLAPDGSTWTILSVSVFDAELMTHLDIFDLEQLDQALDLFHRLAG